MPIQWHVGTHSSWLPNESPPRSNFKIRNRLIIYAPASNNCSHFQWVLTHGWYIIDIMIHVCTVYTFRKYKNLGKITFRKIYVKVSHSSMLLYQELFEKYMKEKNIHETHFN